MVEGHLVAFGPGAKNQIEQHNCMSLAPVIRGNLGSKMGLIRKRSNNKYCELEFKNQENFSKISQP